MEAVPSKRIIVLAAMAGAAASVATCLRAGGHQVHIASDMQSARSLLDAQKADLLLCDAGTVLKVGTPRKTRRDHLNAVTGLVYELRNLLGTLAESIDELSHLTSATPFVGRAEALARGRRRVLRVQEFIDDLLAETQDGGSQELRVEEANLEDLVEGAAISVYSEACRKDQRLVINVDEETVRVRADRAKLKRVLANLLSNAVQHAPVTGTVTVEARREDSYCLIAVSDSGEDGSAGEAPNVFQPAQTADVARRRQAPSRLRIVKGLVELHGGRVWAESRPGRGTTIFVSLPQPATLEEAPGRVSPIVASA